MGPGIHRRTSEIENAVSLLSGETKEVPVQEHVRLYLEIFLERRAPDRFHAVTVSTKKGSRDRPAFMPHSADIRVSGECMQNLAKESYFVNRSSEITHVLAKHAIKIAQKFLTAEFRGHPVALRLSDLGADLRVQGLPHLLGIGIERQYHRYLAASPGEVELPVFAMAQLEMIGANPLR